MQSQQYWFGLPKNLLWGFVAIAIFMAGDGFEMAFLSKHITDMGFRLHSLRWSLRCTVLRRRWRHGPLVWWQS